MKSNFFSSAIVAVAIVAPIGVVIAAGNMPERPETGQFVVSSLGAVLAIIVAALAVRVVYSLGFSQGQKTA
jgi:tetrahydromethanopterin S-methyltransferase subunit C